MAVDANMIFATWLRSLTLNLPSRGSTGSIYVDELPEPFDPGDGMGITVSQHGGKPHIEIPGYIQPRMLVKIWADVRQQQQAHGLYLSLYDLINGKGNIQLSGMGTILSCYEVTPPQDINDPDTDWATVVSFYEFHART